MHADLPSMQQRLQAWREAGADRIDPLRFGLISALARRAASQQGQVRAQLDARLAQLAAAYAQIVAAAPPAADAKAPAPSPLKALLDQLGSVPLQYPLPLHATPAQGNTQGKALGEANEAPLLPVLDEFQQLWTRIRIDSLLRQCLDALPEDAGPLHSSVLTYRAMALMQEVSPDYLQHFIAYVDVLTWMEPLSGTDTVVEPVRVASKRKSASRKKK